MSALASMSYRLQAVSGKVHSFIPAWYCCMSGAILELDRVISEESLFL